MFERFVDLNSLVVYLSTNDTIYYQAPLDRAPGLFRVRQYTVNNNNPERSKATVVNRHTGVLVLNLSEHLERFRAFRPALSVAQ